MIANDKELESTQERIRHFQAQLAYLRKTETNSANLRKSASRFVAEVDRMQLDVRECLGIR
jgi:hypothetical protein